MQSIHFLLSNYGQSLIHLYDDKILNKSEVKEEAENDLKNRHICEIEYNVILNHLEKN